MDLRAVHLKLQASTNLDDYGKSMQRAERQPLRECLLSFAVEEVYALKDFRGRNDTHHSPQAWAVAVILLYLLQRFEGHLARRGKALMNEVLEVGSSGCDEVWRHPGCTVVAGEIREAERQTTKESVSRSRAEQRSHVRNGAGEKDERGNVDDAVGEMMRHRDIEAAHEKTSTELLTTLAGPRLVCLSQPKW